MVGYHFCATLNKIVLVAEAPGDGDAGKTGVLGGLEVHFAVAYVDAVGEGDGAVVEERELADGFVHHVGSGFATEVGSLAYGDVNAVLEEHAVDVLHGRVEFVAYYGGDVTTTLTFMEHVHDAIVGSGLVERMLNVVFSEQLQDLCFQFFGSTRRHILYALVDEILDAITQEATGVLDVVLRKAHHRKRMTNALVKIIKSVGQCAVEIK